MEKPIVVSDIKTHLDVIPYNSKFALIFTPDNLYDWGRKICDVISNIDYFKYNSSKGREIVLKNYTWDIQA